eukprot:366513-Chlamydomonas_euryale.AAC.2
MSLQREEGEGEGKGKQRREGKGKGKGGSHRGTAWSWNMCLLLGRGPLMHWRLVVGTIPAREEVCRGARVANVHTDSCPPCPPDSGTHLPVGARAAERPMQPVALRAVGHRHHVVVTDEERRQQRWVAAAPRQQRRQAPGAHLRGCHKVGASVGRPERDRADRPGGGGTPICLRCVHAASLIVPLPLYICNVCT